MFGFHNKENKFALEYFQSLLTSMDLAFRFVQYLAVLDSASTPIGYAYLMDLSVCELIRLLGGDEQFIRTYRDKITKSVLDMLNKTKEKPIQLFNNNGIKPKISDLTKTKVDKLPDSVLQAFLEKHYEDLMDYIDRKKKEKKKRKKRRKE